MKDNLQDKDDFSEDIILSLPRGSINQMAKELGVHRITITNSLKKKEGYSKDRIKQVYELARRVIAKDIEKKESPRSHVEHHTIRKLAT